MEFSDFERWLKNELRRERHFDNLGKRSKGFTARYTAEGDIEITITSTKSRGIVCHRDVRKIFERYKSLPESERYKVKNYNDPEWPEVNRIYGPYVPAIIKFWEENRYGC